MGKRKAAVTSSDDEDETYQRVAESESPERPLQTARRGGKKAKKAKDDSDESEEETLKSVKKPKIAAKPSSSKKPKALAKEETIEDTGNVHVGVNERGDRFIDLGKKRRATVTTFKGVAYVDVREFYGDEGDLKPGKKGIMLGKDQWDALRKSADVIDALLVKAAK